MRATIVSKDIAALYKQYEKILEKIRDRCRAIQKDLNSGKNEKGCALSTKTIAELTAERDALLEQHKALTISSGLTFVITEGED